MKLQLLNYAVSNLINRKTRSWLTILSILIGITAIFALVSFGLGIDAYVDSVAQDSGIDKLFLQSKGVGAPGTDNNFALQRSDVDFVSKIKGVKRSVPMYMGVGEIKFKDETKYTFLMGSEPIDNDFVFQSFGMDVIKGRQLKSGETGKIFLGYSYLLENKVFKKAITLGESIEINGVDHDVVGFADEVGNPSDDGNIYLSEEGFESLFPDKKDNYGFVMLQSDSNIDPSDLAEKVTEKLRKRKGQEEGKEDFYVQTFADAIATFTVIIDVINAVLILIALISLIVASVIIMNTMYTSVLERTKEIGVMKAIGAKNTDIMQIFIMESALLGIVGGIIGIIFGYFVASTGGAIAKASGFALLQPIFPLSLILGCLLFSFLIGAFSGFLPAIRASKLRPVDALRYE